MKPKYQTVTAILVAALAIEVIALYGRAVAADSPAPTSRQAASLHTFQPIVAWQMVSAPYTFNQTFNQMGVFADVWQAALNQYAVTPNPPADQFHIGQGYWMYLPQGATINGPGTAIDNTRVFTMPLQAGWNQIGNPFLNPIPLANISIVSNAGTLPLTTALANGSVSPFYPYDSVNNTYVTLAAASQSFAPWAGAWLYSAANATIQMQPPSSGGTTGSTTGSVTGGTTGGVSGGTSGGSPWPMFRGNARHTGLGLGSGAAGTQKWGLMLTIHDFQGASPALGPNGDVYATDDNGILFDLDGATGKQKWIFDSGNADNAASSPAAGADGSVYFGAGPNIYAIDGATGKQRWIFRTVNDDFSASVQLFSSSPTIGPDGTVYVAAYFGHLYAMDGATGQQKWVFKQDSVFLSSPAVGADGTIFIGAGTASNPGAVFAINGSTGQQKWAYETPNQDQFASSPAIGGDGTIYIGCGDHNLYALDPITGQKIWSFTAGEDVLSSPAIGPDGTIYFGSHDKNLYAVDPATGLEKWSFAEQDVVYSSPVVGADGTVYIGSNINDGNLYALNGATGQKKWAANIGDAINGSPAIGADGTLYFSTTGGGVFAIR